VKEIIKKYDHSVLGLIPGYAPGNTRTKQWPHVDPSTDENFARILFQEITRETLLEPKRVSVWETPNNKATYDGS